MKAVICEKYGGTDVLKVITMPIPEPKANEILIRIYAASVIPSDIVFREGKPMISRAFTGVYRPKHIPGSQFAGCIEKVGTAVTDYKKGDRIFGTTGTTYGAHATHLSIAADAELTKMPDQLSFEDAVACLDGALTSLVFLRDKAKIKAGQHILINGASGAVGAHAVQIAKYYGAEVTGVCSGKNTEWVKALGADHVIDYTQADFTEKEDKYDFIFDAVGKSSFSAGKNALKPGGVFLETVPTLGSILRMAFSHKSSKKRVLFVAAGLQQSADNVRFIRDLITAGTITPLIDRFYSIDEIVAAHDYVDTGHKRGNVVLQMPE